MLYLNLLAYALPILDTSAATTGTVDTSRSAFAFTVSGGGFHTMTAGVAAARAMSIAGKDWSEVTHLGGVSGGQWFATQFAFSDEFFSSITMPERSLTDILTNFGAKYQENAAPPFKLKMNDFCERYVVDNFDNLVNTLGPFLPTLFKDLLTQSGALSLLDWEAYVSAMLKQNVPVDMTYGEAARTGARKGLKTAALVQGLVLPSDVFLTSGANGQPTLNASVTAMFESFPNAKVPDGTLLPLTHVMKAEDTVVDGWHAPTTTDMSLTVNDGKIDFVAHKNPDQTPFSLAGVDSTTIASVTAGASAALAVAARDTQMKLLIAKLMESIPADKPAIKAAAKLFEAFLYGNCAPFSLQELAPPVKVDVPAADVPEERKTYRTIDGGYIDNTALTSTIAAMTTDCKNGKKLDCAELQVVSINGGSGKENGIVNLFKTDGPFFDDGTTQLWSAAPGVPANKVPKIQIFAEDAPAEEAWTTYATQTFPATGHSYQGKYLALDVTTVDNPAFGVVGDYKVRILFMADNIQDPDIAGVMPNDEDPLIVLPAFGKQKFETVYSPVAEFQSQKVAPILKQWLERSI